MQRILLVEDHASFRQTLAYIFDGESDFEVVAQAGSLAEARRTAVGVGADLGVIDLTLPDGEGVELIRELREANDEFAALILTARVDKSEHARAAEAGGGVVLSRERRGANDEFAALILTASVDKSEHARAVEAGAAGVVHKSANVDDVLDATRRLAAGEALLSQQEIVELLRLAGQAREEEREARGRAGRTTPRERAVLQTLAEGLSNKEIAARLHMSGDRSGE